ncbi:hypothetical protein THASP1DRAFT_21964 [Thamnocephalis sphaerospora]|uniref:Uncharacterized protein n=1 Tax=Thamnocephalis sphaerospora TaxID=78915 RepID=A0A4P9XVK3_9FUNG|nr:hypothetical protein THASP1DRAFT_21964 [Thamnocephalis sphaerospora]|eukprot:RKP10315.1 hypothetical protein THASP1DRAFT_21964 [Thamnocephalis sphaerospora]
MVASRGSQEERYANKDERRSAKNSTGGAAYRSVKLGKSKEIRKCRVGEQDANKVQKCPLLANSRYKRSMLKVLLGLSRPQTSEENGTGLLDTDTRHQANGHLTAALPYKVDILDTLTNSFKEPRTPLGARDAALDKEKVPNSTVYLYEAAHCINATITTTADRIAASAYDADVPPDLCHIGHHADDALS